MMYLYSYRKDFVLSEYIYFIVLRLRSYVYNRIVYPPGLSIEILRYWNCIVLELYRNCIGIVSELYRNCIGIVLELYVNCIGIVLELYWNYMLGICRELYVGVGMSREYVYLCLRTNKI